VRYHPFPTVEGPHADAVTGANPDLRQTCSHAASGVLQFAPREAPPLVERDYGRPIGPARGYFSQLIEGSAFEQLDVGSASITGRSHLKST
jgi:hypothetical protein